MNKKPRQFLTGLIISLLAISGAIAQTAGNKQVV